MDYDIIILKIYLEKEKKIYILQTKHFLRYNNNIHTYNAFRKMMRWVYLKIVMYWRAFFFCSRRSYIMWDTRNIIIIYSYIQIDYIMMKHELCLSCSQNNEYHHFIVTRSLILYNINVRHKISLFFFLIIYLTRHTAKCKSHNGIL